MSTRSSSENPALEPGAVRNFYNQFSEGRSRDYARNGNPRIDKAIARILPLVREDSHVLEIGCGGGFVAEQIARIAVKGFISGCDISDKAIVLARDRVKVANVQFRVLDVGKGFRELKEWLPEPVDLVVMVDVLEHLSLDQHEQFFCNLATIVRSNAVLVLTFPSPDYQRHLRNHHPEELQIIDEIIELPHLHKVAASNGFLIKHFSLEDVWLPNQYVHCILMRGAVNFLSGDNNALAMEEIAGLIQPGEKFILVDQDEWLQKAPPQRQAIPFLERDGIYWGPPADDAVAINECERLRKAGAHYIVFGWPAFWWLDHYASFHRQLRNQWTCHLQNERVIIFRFQK
jgi:SAM-dependent methyltransferase